MGFMSSPSIPGPDPELVKKREEEEARLKQEQEDADARRKDMERKQRANLLGQRSLQDPEAEGFVGFRRRSLGKSIRS